MDDVQPIRAGSVVGLAYERLRALSERGDTNSGGRASRRPCGRRRTSPSTRRSHKAFAVGDGDHAAELMRQHVAAAYSHLSVEAAATETT